MRTLSGYVLLFCCSVLFGIRPVLAHAQSFAHVFSNVSAIDINPAITEIFEIVVATVAVGNTRHSIAFTPDGAPHKLSQGAYDVEKRYLK